MGRLFRAYVAAGVLAAQGARAVGEQRAEVCRPQGGTHCAAQQAGSGAAAGARPAARAGQEHLLLQLAGSSRTTSAQRAKRAPQDVGSGGCNGMPDIDTICSKDGCRVLADDMEGLSCDEYCHRSGRKCVAAWEDFNNTCNAAYVLRCSQPFWKATSDLLCMCAPQVVGLQQLAAKTTNMQLIWTDEFDGPEVNRSKWSLVNGGGGFGNMELQHYTDRVSNAQVRDGVLRITARCESFGREGHTSAKLSTEGATSWGPGHRVEVRAKLPIAKGTWPAIWMLPANKAYGEWPASGEIDIVEAVGCTEGKVYGTVHTGAYNHMKSSQAYNQKALMVSEWHTYAIQWEEAGIQWFVDDELYSTFAPTHRSSDKWPFSQEFFLILNLAVGGSWGGYCLDGAAPVCASDDEFGVMEVDFARVYKL